MSTALKLCFPPYWLWFFIGKPVVWGVRKLFNAPMATVRKWRNSKWYPKTRLGKAVFWSIWGYIAIPGSVPWTLYQLAKVAGFEREAEMVMSWAVTFGHWLWDTAVFSAEVATKVVQLAAMMT